MMTCNKEELYLKLQILNKTLWENKAYKKQIDRWLNNFIGTFNDNNDEKLHALYLLSLFMYFGHYQIRELLRSLYRDVFKYPIIARLRRENNDTKDLDLLEQKFIEELNKTRFLPIGNPSESGSHVLYYFRQENDLEKDLFINSHEIFTRDRNTGEVKLKNTDINRYIFIDDFCGSGHQAEEYSLNIVEDIIDNKKDVEIYYYTLFGSTDGLKHIKSKTKFIPKCIFELDESFKCFSVDSRYFYVNYTNIDKNFAESFCKEYGLRIAPIYPLGYDNSQLLIGFSHNIPDNTLPIIWGESLQDEIVPMFKRYHKL